MRTQTAALSGWGRFPVQTGALARPERYADLAAMPEGGCIARGQGRSYGDAALNEGGRVVLTGRLDRLLDFDAASGVLHAEAGTTVADVLETFVPRGWFLPVTPGTRYVSLGGCVAADVHGKNQHRDGTFGCHVRALEVILADGSRRRCAPGDDLFRATVGGMGLTGIIGTVALALKRIESPRLSVQHHVARDLDELYALTAEGADDDEYTVAWLDGLARGARLGRGVVMRAHHCSAAEAHDAPLDAYRPARGITLPFDLPGFALNTPVARLFNALYFRIQAAKHRPFLSGIDAFFYPLDRLGAWNRLYGKRGFIQYQCVLPSAVAREGAQALLDTLVQEHVPTLLGVLKRFGPRTAGLLSFPMAGYTLALDLPARGSSTRALAARLDAIVRERGGRVYLAKDACLDAASFRAMYPNYAEWFTLKRKFDPQGRLSSSLARRLGLGEAP